jgi:hypothetical protein
MLSTYDLFVFDACSFVFIGGQLMFSIGLDLGQKNDPTAIAVIERIAAMNAYTLRVRHVERLALGTPYPRVVDRVREIVQHDDLSGNCALAVDATGVGAPVVDMLRAARLGCDIAAVSITAGDRLQRSGSSWNIPKRDLLAVMQLTLERGELRIPRNLRQLSSLLRELADFRSTASASGYVRLGADASGEHDDLVIAISLACWRAQGRLAGRDAARNHRSVTNDHYTSVDDYDPVLRFHCRL